MKNLMAALVAGLLLSGTARGGGVDGDVLRVANWLVGVFDSRTQAAADRAGGVASPHEAMTMVGRAVQDPVEFQDALYLYVEIRRDQEARPVSQRIYRLKKSGSRVRIEVLRIDGQLLGPLATDPQMLGSLSPGDLRKEDGCDILLDAKAEEFVGSTGARSCPSEEKGSAYVFSTLRVSANLVLTLDRGYDAKGVQTFGPSDGRPYEFRRVR